MFFNHSTTVEKITRPGKHPLWQQKKLFLALLASTATHNIAVASPSDTPSAKPSAKDLTLLSQLIGAPSATVSLPSSSSTPSQQTVSHKPTPERDPIDLERLRSKLKERIIVNTRHKVSSGEILSGDVGQNEVRTGAELEIEGGQLFLEGADLNNAGTIIVKGPPAGTVNPRRGELILRNASLVGAGTIEVKSGGRLSLEGAGSHRVRGLSIIIRDGGELLMEGDDITFDEYTAPADNITAKGSIKNQGTIRLRGTTRIQPGAHDIDNQDGGVIVLEAGNLEANTINNWPGGQITIEGGSITPDNPLEFSKHLKRGRIRNLWNGITGVSNRRGTIIWRSKTIDVGAPGSPLIVPHNGQEVTEAAIQAFASNVIIENQGDLVLEQQLTTNELQQGPPLKNTTGARVENTPGGVIRGSGLLHATILNNGGTLAEAPLLEAIPQADPSATMCQITGNLSLSSGVYEVSITTAKYGQYWAAGTLSVGASTCKVTTTCATGFPLATYAYPILKSNSGIVDSNSGTKIGFETYQHVSSGSTACTITWVGPSDTTFLCPNAAPVSTGNLTAPPYCFVMKVSSVTFP